MSDRRVALITGCGRSDGLGAAVARRLARQDIAVVITDREQMPERQRYELNAPTNTDWQGLTSLRDELASSGASVLHATGDISTEQGANNLVAAAVAEYGKLDILVNNAAAAHGSEVGLLESIDPTAFDRVYAVNLRGTFLMCKAVMPIMREQGWGRIVNVSSIAAIGGLPHVSAYAATKAGVAGLTRSLAVEAGGAGITVNAVLPGMMVTSRTAAGRNPDNPDREAVRNEFIQTAGARIPVQRAGDADAVAYAVEFLVAPDAWFITGQSIVMDGGESIV